MEIDKTTLNDISIFNHEEELSIFSKLNYTKTVGGKLRLQKMYHQSLPNADSIIEVQKILQLIIDKIQAWPENIGNGTILMIHKFYEAVLDQPPQNPTLISTKYYQFFHRADYSLLKYSVGHCFNFIKGMHQIVDVFLTENAPKKLKSILEIIQLKLQKNHLQIIRDYEKKEQLSPSEIIALGYYLRYHYKQTLLELIELYFQLDAWYGMAKGTKELNLIFPVFKESAEPVLKATQLYHILLEDPVPYDIELNEKNNFIFLTGANMAGKSTFIRSAGSAVFLAHIGMGVPAQSMELSFFDGLLSNINVVDNIVKGESYFYNEVQRIKNTILKISDGRKWLILIDELFKGTNVQDAMKCSIVVIEGLIKIKHSLFILSTHLYEISAQLEKYPNIDFKYFETKVDDEKLSFNYQLRDGVSNDRLGYLILKKEKVIDLLENL